MADDAVLVKSSYSSAEAQVIQPARGTFLTEYFLRRWMPELGPEATCLLITLRRIADAQGVVSVSLNAIAHASGLSARTVRRLLAATDRREAGPLHRFFIVSKRPRFESAGRAGLRRVPDEIRVLLDDPVHPGDTAALAEAMLRSGRANGESEIRSGQFGRIVEEVERQALPSEDPLRSGQSGRIVESEIRVIHNGVLRRGQIGLFVEETEGQPLAGENGLRCGQSGRAPDPDPEACLIKEADRTPDPDPLPEKSKRDAEPVRLRGVPAAQAAQSAGVGRPAAPRFESPPWEDPRVADLTESERRDREHLAEEVGDWLDQKGGFERVGFHPERGLHLRAVLFLGPGNVGEAMRIVDDRLAAARGGRSQALRDPPRFFAAVLARMALEAGIDLRARAEEEVPA